MITKTLTRLSKAIVLCLPAVLLGACGGDDEGGVGNQGDEVPLAVAEVFGAAQATSGVIEARSGKDVLLSGFNSDGVDDPLLHFSWKQVDNSGYEVPLYERNANTVAFTAPEVPLTNNQGVELEFELTVVDADGLQSTDTVSVLVKSAYDANQFLLNPNVDELFIAIVAAPEGTQVVEEIPFVLNMTVDANWQDRQGNDHTIEVGAKSFSGSVRSGVAPGLASNANTYFKIPVPLLDADEINLNFQGEDRPSRLEFELVDEARLAISMTLFQQGSGPVDVYLAREGTTGFEILSSEGMTRNGNTISFDDEWLRQNLLIESRRSANNYYDCIDPDGNAATLAQWIEHAGFNDYPDSVAHTSYVNNYDLNFGRDMYVRQDDNGNVYTYVTNYPTLENIFSGRNEFAIVVMEYSPIPTGNCGDGTFADAANGKKIVKFYSYVPDEVTGEYVRAPSMNFDGRGERMLPGVCVACHYGKINTDHFNNAELSNIDAGSADLDSSFIPWDLDALLYTQGLNSNEVDPVYSSAEISDEITMQFSREAQEENFRLQNQMILNTFTHDINNITRFQTPIKLLHGWYGNGEAVEALNFGSEDSPLSREELQTLQAQVRTLPTGTRFDGNYVQQGWQGQEELYHSVFVRNCRLCHAQVSKANIDFDNYQEFVNNERLVSYIFQRGTMPLSRLTMDRFWISFYGNDAPAEVLRAHLNSDNNPNNDIAQGVKPGFPVADISPERNNELAADVLVDFDGFVLFDGSDSLFSDTFEWSIDNEFVSEEDKFLYTASEPGTSSRVSFLAINSEDSLVSRTEHRTILVNNYTPQADGVPNPSVNEGESVSINIFESLCPGQSPDAPECRSVLGDIRTDEVPSITLGESVTNGSVRLVDATTGIVEFTSTAASFFGNGEFTFTLTDSFGESSDSATVTVAVNSLEGPEVVGPDTCSIDAINYQTEDTYPLSFGAAPCLDPSANDVPPDGLSLQVAEVGIPSQSGSSVAVDDSGTITYTPSRFFVGQDSFSYIVEDNSLSQRSNTGTVVVSVNATQTFTELSTGSGVFARDENDTGCAECHLGDRDEAPNWLQAANVRLAATNTNAQPYGSAEHTLAPPTTRAQLLSSILFQNACNAMDDHTGGNRLCNEAGAPDDISDLNEDGLAILRWLEEGAQDN